MQYGSGSKFVLVDKYIQTSFETCYFHQIYTQTTLIYTFGENMI